MNRPSIAPPPASQDNSGFDSRNVRHGCGFAYNGYRWSSCPSCEADDRRLFALLCCSCRHTYFALEREDLCPRCDSGETAVVAVPDTPAVR